MPLLSTSETPLTPINMSRV